MRRERITESRAIFELCERLSSRVRNPHAVVERAEGVRKIARGFPSRAAQLSRVTHEELLRLSYLFEPEVRPVAGGPVRSVRVEPAEVEEATRHAAGDDDANVDMNWTLREVPVRNVDADVAVNVNILDEAERQVQPPLVVVQAVVDGVSAELVHASLPPPEEKVR